MMKQTPKELSSLTGIGRAILVTSACLGIGLGLCVGAHYLPSDGDSVQIGAGIACLIWMAVAAGVGGYWAPQRSMPNPFLTGCAALGVSVVGLIALLAILNLFLIHVDLDETVTNVSFLLVPGILGVLTAQGRLVRGVRPSDASPSDDLTDDAGQG